MTKTMMKVQKIMNNMNKTTPLIATYRHPMKRFLHKFSMNKNKITKTVHNKMVITQTKINPIKQANRHLIQLYNKKINNMST